MKPLACLSQVRWLSWQDKIAYLAYQFSQNPLPAEPLEHIFEPGWYGRRIRIPAGAYFVGRPHIEGHICKLVSGKIMLVHELGQRYYEAPASLHTVPSLS